MTVRPVRLGLGASAKPVSLGLGASAEPVWLALGSNADGARGHLERALVGLEQAGVRVAAVATPVRGPYAGPDGRPAPGAAPVLNTVVEGTTALGPEALLACAHALEAAAGRVRDGGTQRTLDVDLLACGDVVRTEAPGLPHPRALERAFVLAPWEELAPTATVPGTGRSVLEHAARLRARHPERFLALTTEAPLTLPDLRGAPVVLRDRGALARWRDAAGPHVGLVPTMGALHAGHASLVRRARAGSEAVLATLFVNPLQFGPQEDLARYPRTFDADLALLAASGAHAVYAPAPEDLYPPGFATYVVPEGAALGFEGRHRPGHFRGVATVVLKLLARTRPARAWFGRKDAQQVAVVRRMVADLDLGAEVVVAPTVRDVDGLALSSRNRYLAPAERERARALPRALDDLRFAAARGERDATLLLAPVREALQSAGLGVDDLALVDPEAFAPLDRLGRAPALALATVRVGTTRLLDNRLVALGA